MHSNSPVFRVFSSSKTFMSCHTNAISVKLYLFDVFLYILVYAKKCHSLWINEDKMSKEPGLIGDESYEINV